MHRPKGKRTFWIARGVVTMGSMNRFGYVLRSFRHYSRMHLAVALGTAVGTAALVGALLVGDSMRGSLRDLTLDRLGPVDHLLTTRRFFQFNPETLLQTEGLAGEFDEAVGFILLDGTVSQTGPSPKRASVTVMGVDDTFWALWKTEPPSNEGIVLNRPLAEQLGVNPGDEVIVRFSQQTGIPAESPLGRKSETLRGRRMKVGGIIPAKGPGRFALRPNQQLPRNAYISLKELQRLLDAEGINTIAVTRSGPGPAPPEATRRLNAAARPRPEDLELHLSEKKDGYVRLTSDRMMLADAESAAAAEALRKSGVANVEPVFVYLANAIGLGDRQTPYSTVAAFEDAKDAPQGRLVDDNGTPIGPIAEGAVVLNRWTADDLGAKPGDTVGLTFFEPESVDGQTRETTVKLKVQAIAAMRGPGADPFLTPEVEGLTDQDSIANWNPPFPFDSRRIRDKDETYWDEFRAAPKAFVAPQTAKRLWGSRFGDTTSLVFSLPATTTLDTLSKNLKVNPAPFGFAFQPIKRQGLAASQGNTPYQVLFLSFSFFVIGAAAMLVALLFRLGVDMRVREIGLLLAVGFEPKRIRRLFLAEGLLTAFAGSLLGVAAGLGYARLMLAGLQTWWLDAIVTPFLTLHATGLSLASGFLGGLILAFVAIFFAVRHAGKETPRALLAGRLEHLASRETSGRRTRLVGWAVVAALVLLGLFAARVGEEIRAGLFFGTGVLFLAAALLLFWSWLRGGSRRISAAAPIGRLSMLAVRNATRHPWRSALCVGLIASTCFLILSVSAFRIDPVGKKPSLDSGDGGLALIAETDQPVFYDVTSPDGRADLGFSREADTLTEGATVFPCRVKPGDDATCLNLYLPRRPRMLGLGDDFLQRGGFAWADVPPNAKANPWKVLENDLAPAEDGTPRVPVVLEKNTANYILHLWGGLGEEFDVVNSRGQTVRLVVSGLLAGSIFQGDLLLSEAQLLRHFADVAGYRAYLIETAQPEQVAAAWNDVLGEYGVRLETTGDRLRRLLAVQNTYLSTFQSLGGLGLMLGTFGLAVVQLRNVLERRHELALLRALGFRRRSLGLFVLAENAFLLLAGLSVGSLAAAVALLPHLFGGEAAIPWMSLGATVLLVLLVGLASSWFAVRAVMEAPLIPALRNE